VHIHPTDENVHALIDRGIDGPVVMLNLLRLRDMADYSDHPELAPASPTGLGHRSAALEDSRLFPLVDTTPR
jgi:hypothetical protein